MYCSLLLVVSLLSAARACYDAKDIQLEVVIHQTMHDLSRWHWINRGNLKYSVQNTRDALKGKFPEAKCTLVSFQDYGVSRRHDACYRHYYPLDEASAVDKALDALLGDEFVSRSLVNGKYESSLSALALTATRPQDNHFSSGTFTEDGKRVVRVLVLVAGAIPYQHGQAPEVMGKDLFPIDGSGNCLFEPPTMGQVSKILQEKDLQLVVLASKESYDWWEDQGYRWFGNRVLVKKIDDIFGYQGSLVVSGIKDQLCNVASTTTKAPPTPIPTLTPELKCLDKSNVQLQLVIHQPFYSLEGMNLNSFHLRKTLDAYKDVVVANFKDAQYTIAGFEDYRTSVHREGCWYPGYPLSRSMAYELSLVSIWASSPGDLEDPSYESSLSALALTATTDKLSFAEGPVSPEGKPYAKVMALITGARPYLSGQIKPNSPAFAPDGTADCRSDAPTLEQFRDIVFEKDLRLVVLGHGEGYKWWSTVGKKLLGSRMVIKEVDSIYKVPASYLSTLVGEVMCPVVPTSSTSTVAPTKPTTRFVSSSSTKLTSTSTEITTTSKQRHKCCCCCK